MMPVCFVWIFPQDERKYYFMNKSNEKAKTNDSVVLPTDVCAANNFIHLYSVKKLIYTRKKAMWGHILTFI